MLNTIKMDLYRMIKNKSTFIILGILFALNIFNVSILGLSGIMHASGDSARKFDVLSRVFTGNSASILFLSIFTVIYSSSMYKTGYIKNIVGKVNYRTDLIISNIIIILIYTAAAFVTVFIATTIGGLIGFKSIEFIGFKGFFVASILQYISLVTFMMGILLLVTLLRKSGGVMAISIIYITGIGGAIWSLLDLLVAKYISKTIKIMEYSVLCNMQEARMTSDINFDNYWKPMIVALVWATIFITSTIVVMNKKDIA